MTLLNKKALIVFSGSGSLYPLHLGALCRLEEAGYEPSALAGVSGGALVASLRARGLSGPDALQVLIQDRPTWRFWDWNVLGWMPGRWGAFGGKKLQKMLRKRFPGPLSDALLPVRIVTTPLTFGPDQEPGPALWGSDLTPEASWSDVLRASMTLPGVFPPVRLPDGRLHVDGGVTNNLPVDAWGPQSGPVIVLQVYKGAKGAQAPTSLAGYVNRLLDLALDSSSRELLEQFPGALLLRLIPDPEMEALVDLNVSEEETRKLWQSGWSQADAWLKRDQ